MVVNNEFTAPVTLANNTIEGFNTILQGIGSQSGNVNASGGTIAASTNTTPFVTAATTNLSTLLGNQTVTLTKNYEMAVGGSGLATVILDATLDTVYGGSGGVAVSGDGGQTVYTQAGSTNTIQSSGSGNNYFSFGNDTITVAGGNTYYDIYGTADVNGSAIASNEEDSFVAGGGVENFNMQGAAENFSLYPGGTANIDGVSRYIILAETEATVNFDFSSNSTVYSGSFIGGEVQTTNGKMTIYQAPSRATLDLVQGTYTINDIAGSMISAGGATVTVDEGGGTGLTFIGGSGAETVNTDPGGATIFVGSGSLRVNEHAIDGPVVYNFNEAIGAGTVTINDFRPSKDSFAYSGFTGNPIESQTVSGGSLHLALQNNTTIILLGETKL